MLPEENRPMTAEGYVMSELYKAKDHEQKLTEDLQQARDRVDELEEQLNIIRKVLEPLGLHVEDDTWLQAEHSYVRLEGVGRENVAHFLDIMNGTSES